MGKSLPNFSPLTRSSVSGSRSVPDDVTRKTGSGLDTSTPSSVSNDVIVEFPYSHVDAETSPVNITRSSAVAVIADRTANDVRYN